MVNILSQSRLEFQSDLFIHNANNGINNTVGRCEIFLITANYSTNVSSLMRFITIPGFLIPKHRQCRQSDSLNMNDDV